MYVGWGLKFQPPNFSPLQLPKPQDEYPIGPEVMEMADPTFADEEVSMKLDHASLISLPIRLVMCSG